MFLCLHVHVTNLLESPKNMHVAMYFIHLVLAFTPHYIITDKGLLNIPIHHTTDCVHTIV